MKPSKEYIFNAMQTHDHNIYEASRALGIAASTIHQTRLDFQDWWENRLNPKPKPIKKKPEYVPYETKEFKFNPYIESLLDSYFKKWQE